MKKLTNKEILALLQELPHSPQWRMLVEEIGKGHFRTTSSISYKIAKTLQEKGDFDYKFTAEEKEEFRQMYMPTLKHIEALIRQTRRRIKQGAPMHPIEG